MHFIRPNVTYTFQLPAGRSVNISSFGSGGCKVYVERYLLKTIFKRNLGETKIGSNTYGPFTSNRNIRIEAGSGGASFGIVTLSPAENKDFKIHFFPKLAFVGDSLYAVTNNQDTATATYNCCCGPGFIVPFLTGQRVRTSKALNFGVPGDNTQDIVNRLGVVAASEADIYVENGGTNDLTTGLTLSQFVVNKNMIWNTLLSTGAIVIASTISPRNLLGNQTLIDQLWAMNQFIKQSNSFGRKNFYVVDNTITFGDPLSATMAPRPRYSYDGLHPTDLGAYYAFRPIADLINSIILKPLTTFTGISDIWSPTNITGNMIPNGILAGTSGTFAEGFLSSGTVANNCILFAKDYGGVTTSLVVEGSNSVGSDGRPVQTLTFGGSYRGAGGPFPDAATSVGFTQNVAIPGNFVAGDTLEMMADILVEAGSVNIAGIEAILGVTADGVKYINSDGCVLGGTIPPTEFRGTFRTPPFTLSAKASVISATIYIYLAHGDLTPTLTLNIQGMSVRKIVNYV